MNWIHKVIGALFPSARPNVVGEMRVKLDFEVDTAAIDDLTATTDHLHARWSEIGAVAAGVIAALPAHSTVTRLDVAAGDILVLACPTVLKSEQRDHLVAHFSRLVGNGPRMLVLDGGMSLAHVVRTVTVSAPVTEGEGGSKV